MNFVERHVMANNDDYFCFLDEYCMPDGRQFLLAHMDVRPHRFSASVLKRMKYEFACFRACTDAPVYAMTTVLGNEEKLERFLSHFGFRFLTHVTTPDGASRRVFVNFKETANGRRIQRTLGDQVRDRAHGAGTVDAAAAVSA